MFDIKKIIICEKPSLAMNVVSAIGHMEKNDGYFENNNYVVTFAFGHLLVLYDIDDYFNREKTKWSLEELPYIPKEFLFKVKDDPGIKKQFKIIKQLIKRNDISEIVNCGDADREGEVIINNIIYFVFNELNISKPITRLWLPEQTLETIKNALQTMKSINETRNLMNEGLARTYIDWLYGINLTRYLSLKVASKFPVGRVLVPVVKYVYDRDMAIKNFVPKHYLDIDTIINKDNENIKLIFKDFKFSDDSMESECEAKSLIYKLSNEKILVEDVCAKDKVKQRPKLFSLDTLQNHMFKKYKISLADTLKSLQSLYEHGYVTYPRTNTEYLSNNQKDDIKKLIISFNDSNLDFIDKKSIFDDSKIESHSALTPTLKKPSSLSGNEELVYNTIKNRFCAVFCKEDAVINEVVTIFNFTNTEYNTKLSSSSIKQLGFLRYEPIDEKLLPDFEVGETFVPKLEIVNKETTPPTKATDADLNRFLKNPYKSSDMPGEDSILEENSNEANDELLYKEILDGIEIGTVATRSGIIENAIKYEYIKKYKNSLSISDKGISLIENLNKLNIDMSVDKTVDVSKKLKKVFKNEYAIDQLVKDISSEIHNYIDQDIQINAYVQEKESIGLCPKCGKNVIENQKSFYCEDYKNCNFSIWKKNKFFETIGLRNFTKSNMKSCLEKGYFQVKRLKSKTGKEYDAKLVMELTDKYVNWKIDLSK